MTTNSLSDELGNGTSTELAHPLTTSQKLLRPCTSWVNGERPESFRVEKIVPAENGRSGEHKVCRFLYLHPRPRSVDSAFDSGKRATGVVYGKACLHKPSDPGQLVAMRWLNLADQRFESQCTVLWGLSAKPQNGMVADVIPTLAVQQSVSYLRTLCEGLMTLVNTDK